ncbi:hypothetical protein [Streptomyces vietnamensis]|uniref:Uncharacterized protein n=1 Tax=Streptomyces vietnamensis TaxID=362257 RepID=A0A0B5IHJ6_9ACTN|nr:hypothetical protein [Streptomyces vietnamensis]AJF67809.1 hypothetical protein SVTN_28990 [Streptomyces vietnamensis]
MTRSENEVDQIVFRWDSENLTGNTGFGPVAWSGPRDEAENLFRISGPVLRASGEETRPALIRLQQRAGVMLIRRLPFTDADGGTSVLCHALVGSPALLDPAVCLGLHAWNWEGAAAVDLAEARGGRLPVVREEVLIPATGRGQGALDETLPYVAEELTGTVAELLRHPDDRFTVLDERGDTACAVLWGLHSMFEAVVDRRWTFATHDTVELPALRFAFVGRWSGAASRNTERRRVDPRERCGDRAEELATRLVRHHLRGVAEGEGSEYAVGSALHAAATARRTPLLETAARALTTLDKTTRPADPSPRRRQGAPDSRHPAAPDGRHPGTSDFGHSAAPAPRYSNAPRAAYLDPAGDGQADPRGSQYPSSRGPWSAAPGPVPAPAPSGRADGAGPVDAAAVDGPARAGTERPESPGRRPEAGDRWGTSWPTDPPDTSDDHVPEPPSDPGPAPRTAPAYPPEPPPAPVPPPPSVPRSPAEPPPAPRPADEPHGAGAFPRPVLPLVEPQWTGPGKGARRRRSREREVETSLVHKLPTVRSVEEARELVSRGGSRELLDALRRPQAYAVVTVLLREVARRLPSWGHPLRRELCDVVIHRELWAVAPPAARNDPEEPAEGLRAANAAELHRWAVRPLLGRGDAPVGTVAELLSRLRTRPEPSAREAFWLIVDGERPGLPDAVWLTLLKEAYGMPRTVHRPAGPPLAHPDDPGSGYTRRFLRRAALLIGGLVVAIVLIGVAQWGR